jgi:DHA2 family multidrug resistance protein
LSTIIPPKYLLIGAFCTIALAMYRLTSLTPDVSFGWVATQRAIQMIAMPFHFVPVTAVSYIGLPPEKSGEASSLINVFRNLGGSIGVATAQTLLARREQFHQARLAEHINSSREIYSDISRQVENYFISHGAVAVDAQHRAIASIGSTIQAQVALLSYIDLFAVLEVFAICMVPVPLLLRTGSK